MKLFECVCLLFFFFKQKTAYEMRISDWSSDVCSSDLARRVAAAGVPHQPGAIALRQRAQRPEGPRYAAAHASRPRFHARSRHRLGDRADRKSTRLTSSHTCAYRMPSSARKKIINTTLTLITQSS